MKWKILAIVNDQGQDLYIGDTINLGGQMQEIITINLINGMLIINGMVIDVEKVNTDEESKEDTTQVTGDGQCNGDDLSHEEGITG